RATGTNSSSPACAAVGFRDHGGAVARDHRLATALAMDGDPARHGVGHARPLRLIHAQLRRVCRLSFYLRAQFAEVATRTRRAATRFEGQDAPPRLLHIDQLPADHGDGRFLVPVSESIAGEMVQPAARGDFATGTE